MVVAVLFLNISMLYSWQMGGDFVVNKQGRLTLVHCSKSSSDRPAVTDLLKHVVR